ncbi:MAG: lysophospholipid acyltransferase family protein [Planctomycetota bacterium]
MSELTAYRPQGRDGLTKQALVHFIIGRGLRLLVRFCYRVRIRRHPLWQHQVCVLAANHRSFADPPLVAMFSRYADAFFARATLWKLPVVGHVLRLVGGVPVDRARPSPRAMAQVVQELRGGRNLVVFPEGTRSRDGRLGRVYEGPALFARRAGVPVVPVYVHRSDLAWPRGGILPRLCCGLEIRYGRPIRAPAHLSARQQDRWLTSYIDRWLRAQEQQLMGPSA